MNKSDLVNEVAKVVRTKKEAQEAWIAKPKTWQTMQGALKLGNLTFLFLF